MQEIRIRNVDAKVVLRLDTMAKENGMNRSEYLRGVLSNYAYSVPIKETEDRYMELFKFVLDTIEGNTQILHEILVELKQRKGEANEGKTI